MIYKTTMYLEELYQQSKVEGSGVSSFVIYGILRDNGFTVEQVMQYMGYHSKCHLTGSGDKDSWLVNDGNGNLIPDYTKTNANELLRLTLAYNRYTNMGQRVPMIRAGVGHLYNCYIDDMGFEEIKKLFYTDPMNKGMNIKDQITAAGGNCVLLTRCMNPRNGASIAADTCVFYGAMSPVLTDELQNLTISNVSFSTYNHGLIVNSSTQKIGDTKAYVGSSWDNNGVNPFTNEYTWHDKSTLGNWSWGQEGDALSYKYQTFPLEDVANNTSTYGGAFKIDMDASDWLKTEYASDFTIQKVDETKSIPIENVTLNKTEQTIFKNELLQLDVNKYPFNTTEKESTFHWTSSDDSIARVSDCGLVTPLKTGETTIRVTTENGKTAECKVTVSELPTAVSVSNNPTQLYVGDIIRLSAKVEPNSIQDTGISWTSNSNKIHVIDSNEGIIEAKTSGKALMTATATLRGNRVGSTPAYANHSITVMDTPIFVSDVALVESETVGVNCKLRLTASIESSNATNRSVYWSSSDENTVTVDQNGNITGIQEGSAIITVTSVNKGYTATCNVTVSSDQTFQRGDIDMDGSVDLNDANLALKAALKIKKLTDEEIKIADVDGDGEVTLADANAILKRALNIE